VQIDLVMPSVNIGHRYKLILADVPLHPKSRYGPVMFSPDYDHERSLRHAGDGEIGL